jgi:hypothetical protein
MEKETSEILSFILKTLQESKDFVKEQAPDIVQQALAFGIYDSKMFLWLGVFILVVSAVLFLSILIFDNVGLVFFALPSLALGALLVFCSVSQMKKIELAPKLYLLERFTPKRCSK